MAAADLHGLHVFVLEGDQHARELIRTALESQGAFVTTPASVERAKALLRAVRPDVLIADIETLPRDTSPMREVLGIVEQLGIRVPVIALTHGGERRHALLEQGFADVMEGPFDPTRLCALVKMRVVAAHGPSLS